MEENPGPWDSASGGTPLLHAVEYRSAKLGASQCTCCSLYRSLKPRCAGEGGLCAGCSLCTVMHCSAIVPYSTVFFFESHPCLPLYRSRLPRCGWRGCTWHGWSGSSRGWGTPQRMSSRGSSCCCRACALPSGRTRCPVSPLYCTYCASSVLQHDIVHF